MLGRPSSGVNSTRPRLKPLVIEHGRAGLSRTICTEAPYGQESRPILTKGGLAIEAGSGSKFFLNAEKLVVFGDAVGAAGGAGQPTSPH